MSHGSGSPPTLDQVARDLGQLILKANPYKVGHGDNAPSDFRLMAPPIEKENYEEYATGGWKFRGVERRVAKSIRVRYCYRDADGILNEDFLLIGYEGAGPG